MGCADDQDQFVAAFAHYKLPKKQKLSCQEPNLLPISDEIFGSFTRMSNRYLSYLISISDLDVTLPRREDQKVFE